MARGSTAVNRGGGRGSGPDDCNIGNDVHSHSNAHETPLHDESSDDDESIVGRRGSVAPTPLPQPRNRDWIWIIHGQFSNQGKATRIIGENLQAMWTHPWLSWKEVSKEDRDRLFQRFKGYYQWEEEWDDQIRSCWEKFIKRKFKDSLNRARENAKTAAVKAGVEVGEDLSVITPYKPQWMRCEIWESLVQKWNTPAWKAKSATNTTNRGKSNEGKHTLGSQSYVTLKLKLDDYFGRPATLDEIWMQSHGKKGTRPLDRLSSHKEGEGLELTDDLEEIDLENDVVWVDPKAKNSIISYKEQVKQKYTDGSNKRPIFDVHTWTEVVGGKKKGRLYGFNDVSDPSVMMTGKPSTPSTSTLPTRNEEVQRLNEKIAQLEQEKEAERVEKEKERAEKVTMMEKDRRK
ncbi:hypothetical protein SSX86_022582 [Deinandra increscens subsp. villosa]|uniref:Transposase, Ptta/En/Spm, plant n=1 Tax=Deinandra increscens subsp. villosa TaxID=3103831 RepID=A0AAP0CR12_9ASTR